MAESKIPLMEDDVEIIKKLGNKPGSENKLQTSELKSKFDEGSVLLKTHLNKVIGILNTMLGSSGSLLSGGNMMGALNMNGYRLFGISNPTDWNHAANKKYVDDAVETVEEYVDGKHLEASVSLPASGWSDAAPYTQAVNVDGITANDKPHYGVVYSGDTAAQLAQKEAFAAVDDLETGEGAVTFTCFEDKPETDLTVQLEVNR